MRARFTRAAARVEILIGTFIIVLGLVLAALAILLPAELFGNLKSLPPGVQTAYRALIAVAAVGASVVIATPIIIFGQLVLVFLDVRARLARIDVRLRRWERARETAETETPLTERLRPRWRTEDRP